jgi:hypothetical protein
MDDAEIIAFILTKIRDYNISLPNLRNDIEDVMLCIHDSYCIGRVAHTFQIPNDDVPNSFLEVTTQLEPYQPLARRVQKLRFYYGAVQRISQYLSEPQYSAYRNNIAFTEVDVFII